MTDIDSPDAPLMLARRQFNAFEQIGHEVAITEERQRKLLSMSQQEWSVWKAYAQGGAAPAVTSVPEVLLRMANASYRLAARADRGSGLV